jgi:hypothetical protein
VDDTLKPEFRQMPENENTVSSREQGQKGSREKAAKRRLAGAGIAPADT